MYGRSTSGQPWGRRKRRRRESAVALLTDNEREVASALAQLTLVNPFLPQRIDCERQALGEQFVEHQAVWHVRADAGELANPNLDRLTRTAQQLAIDLCRRLEGGATAGKRDARIYRDLVLYALYRRYQAELQRPIRAGSSREAAQRGGAASFPIYRRFVADLDRFFAPGGIAGKIDVLDPAHLFACFFQVRRAFHYIHRFIIGGSMPAAKLRAAVWESIFSHDMRRYRRVLYRQMGDVTTLITGPSGTGKELVARAIALGRYIPFDARKLRFEEGFAAAFFPLNLSALSPTLIESELFGHRRGSFTGAVEDRTGWLEACPACGTVFLDEIGEITSAVQVELLRVLENRSFQRLGETHERDFRGKIVAATNRDLDREMRAGRFREDLYYRLCADTVCTPSLAERLEDSPRELALLVRHMATRMVGAEEAEGLVEEVTEWVEQEMNPYCWPGNVRELSQCVRNILIRRSYRPPACEPAALGAVEELTRQTAAGELTADQLLSRYVTLVYARTGSYQEAARRLGLDRRTVKARIDAPMLTRLREEFGEE